jgi:hypothetical protein
MRYVYLFFVLGLSSFHSVQFETSKIGLSTESFYVLDSVRLKSKVAEALAFNKKNKLNQDFAILIDMKIHSGRNRFFVYDFKKNEILKSGLVSHGCCNSPWTGDESKEKPVFSNVGESHCSSLGKYKIGKRGWSSFGIHVNYKMHGLESSNSNALKRLIVLHSWDAVDDQETYPVGTPEGWGCPAISNDFMRYLDRKLKGTKIPVLLWVYR